MRKPYWTNRLAEPGEKAALVQFARLVHGGEHPGIEEASWRWRYANDCGFQVDILVAEYEGRPIGILPVALFDFQWQERRFPGAMYTGLLTHPDHRRRGVFRSLIDSANQLMASRGALFSMGMPNDASLPGFIKFGDWICPAPIPLFLKVVDSRRVFSNRTACAAGTLLKWLPRFLFRPRRREHERDRFTCEPAAVLPEQFDEVFAQFARADGGLMLRRTAAYWNWRYGLKPGSAYRTFVLRRTGELVGAAVTSVGRRLGLDIGMILDAVACGGVAPLRGLLREAEAELVSRGLGLVTCQATGTLLRSALQEEGYWRPNPGWLPKRFHLIFRLTGVPGLPRVPARLTDWHLTFGDSDNV